MNENINLCEILKDCPKGTKLYSPLFGEVEFIETNKMEYPIVIRAYFYNKYYPNGFCAKKYFRSDGKYYEGYKDTECVLFPSKDQRDWSKWKCPKPKFDPKSLQPFDKILIRDQDDESWYCTLFSHLNDNKCYAIYDHYYNYIVPYNEDTKHLVGTTDEAPDFYRYWED